MDKVFNEDCLETIKRLPDNSIDLIVTSPPYLEMKSYGKAVTNKDDQEWVDWLVSIFKSLHPKLKDTGSIIINVNAPIKNKCRSLAPQRLQVALSDLYCHFDSYIWAKKNGIPSASQKRLDGKHEYIFHFTKTNAPKMDASKVKVKKSEGALKRQEYSVQYPVDMVNDGGVVTSVAQNKMVDGDMRYPFSWLQFANASAMRDKPQNKHPAPFHPELPEFFIKMLTDEGDVVYDPFMGSGTTAYAAILLNRNWIGSELNPSYIELVEENVRIAEEKRGSK
jgi:DNA modification methylase